MTTKISIAWLTINEATDGNGFYLEGDAAIAAERKALAEAGAPETEAIEFKSILPEDRDTAMAEAMVTPALAEWLRNPENDMVVYED